MPDSYDIDLPKLKEIKKPSFKEQIENKRAMYMKEVDKCDQILDYMEKYPEVEKFMDMINNKIR